MSKPKPTPKASSASATPAKKKTATKQKTAAKAATPAKKTATSKAVAKSSAAEKAFIEASIARGEAQAAGKDGSLPEGATHELVESPNGKQTVRRRRFSAA